MRDLTRHGFERGTLWLALLALPVAGALGARAAHSEEPKGADIVGWRVYVPEAGLVRVPVNDLPGHANCAAPGAKAGCDPQLVLTRAGQPVPFYMSDANTLVFVGEPDPACLDSRGTCYHLRPQKPGDTPARLGARPTVAAPPDTAKIVARSGKARAYPLRARTYDPLEALDVAALAPVAKAGGYWFYQGDRDAFERGRATGDCELVFDTRPARGTSAELELEQVYVEQLVEQPLPGGRVYRTLGLSSKCQPVPVKVILPSAGRMVLTTLQLGGGRAQDARATLGSLSLAPDRNAVRLVPPAGSRVLVQRAWLDYERAAVLEPEDSALVLEATVGETTAIEGLTSTGVVADLTDLDLLTPQYTDAGAVVRCPRGHKLVAFVPSRARGRPLENCYTNDLQTKQAGADWVAIGPRSILDAVAPLAAHRQSQGLKTKLVALEDVDDDFGDGAWGAESLRAFLAFALKNWQTPPRFVLLVGDSLRDGRPVGKDAWVPTALVDTFDNGASASDRMLLPEDARGSAAIGRFPVRTIEQCSDLAQKTIAYEKAPPHPGQKQLSFVCGEGRFGPMVDGMIEQLFTSAVGKRVPEAFDVDVTYGNPSSVFLYPPDQFSQKVVDRLSQGPLIFDYIGHGAPWALDDVHVPLEAATKKNPWPPEKRFPILRCEDADKVACQPGQNPIVLITACWTGAFDQPERTVGEALLLNPRGAVAVLAASRVSHPLANALLSLELTESLFARTEDDSKPRSRLGERVTKAVAHLSTKSGGEEGELVMNFASMMIEEKGLPERVCEDDRRLFNLLGDPALVVHEPQVAKLWTVAPERNPAGFEPGEMVHLQADGGPLYTEVTLERLRGVPETVKGLPGATTGRQLIEDPEVRARVLATYARANDPVLARGNYMTRGSADITLPRDLAPGTYLVKIAGEGLVGSVRIKVVAAAKPPQATQPDVPAKPADPAPAAPTKKWY